MLAYRSGIFPMADSRDDSEIFWIEPRQRAILPLDGFHLSHSLARTLRRGRFAVTCNAAFSEVMEACAAPRKGEGGESWISYRIQRSYEQLHDLGLAHSIECWHIDDDGTRHLVGGLYGVGFDRVFCGESMFSRATDSSKVALAWLVAALRKARIDLLDCQFITPHLASLGAIEISQKRYLKLLRAAQSSVPAGLPSADGADVDGIGAAGPETVGASSSAGSLDAGLSTMPAGFEALLEDARSAGLESCPGKLIAQFLTQTS